LSGILSGGNAEIIDPFLIKGYPRESDFALLDGLAEKIKNMHTREGLM
jgi:hypothetical protein